MVRDRIKKLIAENNILPESRFGQNFLCDDTVIDEICDLTNAGCNTKVLEIGPGLGSLTVELTNRNTDLTVIEIDKRLAEILRNDSDIEANIICSDYLKLKDYDAQGFNVVVSNLPYYCMTDIMKKVFAECTGATKLVFMVEEDAIARIKASPKTKQYGPLAVLCSIYGEVKEEITVPGNCFIPAPRTTSAVISLTAGDTRILSPEFIRFVDSCFAQRRKKLSNSLKIYPKDKVTDAYSVLGLDLNVRAEELSPETFISLYDVIIK
ncbi:MAG: 16S rRNA (adenine(1518)-N(6)/adenine(1519)-N(6))-dimethyltransferase RsmA [Saccharofermentans sp.]|nr:16S rRNA (adenine(1518)-N(6)/adenine(1519)-N(6))-dimethyltransferase RsmA [Saccharofermentans sp.]